jgi:kinesin family protein 5
MMFLERNLEQLTVVQRQLVEQNSSLKKEVAIAERKLIARNERIQSLEQLLQDSQEKLTAANHRYVEISSYPDLFGQAWNAKLLSSIFDKCHPDAAPRPYHLTLNSPLSAPDGWTLINGPHRFEAQLTAVKERLEAAKQGSTRGLGSPTSGASFAFGGAVGSRIAKPLRGGGGPVQDGPVLPVLSNLQAQEAGSGQGKRTSWFFNQRS